MSLKPQGISPVPEETARIARAAYPKGNVYMNMLDELGTIYEDALFADLFSHTGQPAEAPWRFSWLPSFSLLRDSQTGKPLMRYGVALM
jgi:transposase